MSAPATHDPLVVNTQDGVTWLRRAVVDGRGLYAVTDSCACPEYPMATLADLAEHGIAGSADVLPMPVGPGPVVRPIEVHEAQIDALAASGNRAVNDANHDNLCMCDAWPEKCLSSGGYFQGYWDMGGLETAIPAVLGLWESMRGGELERLRARVAELEADNAALQQDKEYILAAAERRMARLEREPERLSYAELAKRERVPARRAAWRMLAQVEESERVADMLLAPEAGGSADRLTALLAPTQAPRDPQSCQACGDLPEAWCPDCAACKAGCFGGFDGNSCSHANTSWGGVS